MFIFTLAYTVSFTEDLGLCLLIRKYTNISKKTRTLVNHRCQVQTHCWLGNPRVWMDDGSLSDIHRFQTLENMETTLETQLKTPATRGELWMICIWRYWAGENVIFYIMFSHAKFEPPQHSLISMMLLNSSYYLKNWNGDELSRLILDLNAKFSKISGLNWIRIR